MATQKQIDIALKVLNEKLDSTYEVRYDGVNLYYEYRGGIPKINSFLLKSTRPTILEIIWAMRTIADITKS